MKRRCPGLFDLLQTAAVGGGHISTFQEKIAVAIDDGKQVIEIVGHATGEQADRFHFLGLLQKFFRAGQGFLRNFLFGLGAIEHKCQTPHQGREQHDLGHNQARNAQPHIARKQLAVDAHAPKPAGANAATGKSLRASQPPG